MRWGRRDCPRVSSGDPDNTLFPMVDTETVFGVENKVKMRVPIFTGALGSTEIARKNWEHFAVGAAISGVSIVCGENVCGIDPALELDSKARSSRRRTWSAGSRCSAATRRTATATSSCR